MSLQHFTEADKIALIWFSLWILVCLIGEFIRWLLKPPRDNYFIKTPLVPDSRDSLEQFKREMKYWNRP